MPDDKGMQRKIDRHREGEARWLQKMLFAAGKARESRAKLSDATGEDLNPLIILEDGTEVTLDVLEEIIKTRVKTLMETLGRGVYGIRP